eukprot:2495165-Rhodomonas_salina.2
MDAPPPHSDGFWTVCCFWAYSQHNQTNHRVERICRKERSSKLVICGHILEDAEMLEEIPAESTLHLSLGLLGGGKKRKKKTYTKPKKIKHKHKKVKLAVLKYYKVDQQSGKITRLRKECQKGCGAGIFMANHFNRSYCGKCHTTYMLDKPGRDPALDKKKDGGAEAAAAAAAAPAKGGKKKK